MLSKWQFEAVQMLQAGWTVRHFEPDDCIAWMSPNGLSGSDYMSVSIDIPPSKAVADARMAGHIVDRPICSKNIPKIKDFDVWYQPCKHCGYDTGKSRILHDPRCWKCGRHIQRDFSERARKHVQVD